MAINGQWQVAMPSQAKSLIKDIEGDNFPYEMYRFFLKNNCRMFYFGDYIMKSLEKYSNSIEIDEKICAEKRNRVFSRQLTHSVIVNEIKGIFELLYQCVKYVGFTIKLWAIKLKAI